MTKRSFAQRLTGQDGLSQPRLSQSQKRKKKTVAAKKTTAMVRREAKKVLMNLHEKKYKLSTVDENSLGSDQLNYLMDFTGIGTGDTKNDREGKQIIAKNIGIRLFFHNNSYVEPVWVKMMLIQNKSGNTTQMSASTACWYNGDKDTLSSKTDLGSMRTMLSSLSPEFGRILKSKMFQLGPQTHKDLDGSAAGISNIHSYHDGMSSSKLVNMYHTFKGGKKINYSADGSTATNCQDRIQLIIISTQADQDQFFSSYIELTGHGKLNFVDP